MRLPIFFYRSKQQGLTLIEVMIALTLGLVLILIVTGIVVHSKSTQAAQTDLAAMQDTARFALDNISRSVRQAGYLNYDELDTSLESSEARDANVMGFDAKSMSAKTANISQPIASSNNSSDILALRFEGSGQPADGSILNCAGYAEAAENTRAWSIYYIANSSGEPALFCKYRGKKGTYESISIALGVESFQVLYGINFGSSGNGPTEQFLSATDIAALDAHISPSELSKKTHWKKVTSVKVALLIRGSSKSRMDEATIHTLFGPTYNNQNDAGTQLDEAKLPKSAQAYFRKIYSTTIELNNPNSSEQ